MSVGQMVSDQNSRHQFFLTFLTLTLEPDIIEIVAAVQLVRSDKISTLVYYFLVRKMHAVEALCLALCLDFGKIM